MGIFAFIQSREYAKRRAQLWWAWSDVERSRHVWNLHIVIPVEEALTLQPAIYNPYICRFISQNQRILIFLPRFTFWIESLDNHRIISLAGCALCHAGLSGNFERVWRAQRVGLEHRIRFWNSFLAIVCIWRQTPSFVVGAKENGKGEVGNRQTGISSIRPSQAISRQQESFLRMPHLRKCRSFARQKWC